MNVIITEPFDSFWSPHCASDNNNASVPWRRDFFIKFPDFGVDGYVDLETVILLAVKFALLCIALYLAKCVLFFVHWLLFLPFNWTRDLTDIGFYHIKSVSKAHKKDAINRARRLRRAGDRMPPPYPNGWYGLAESADIKFEEAISVNALGQNFVIFRTNRGEVHILDAYCPHLGANLGVGGIVRGDCIECPFHQWKFRGSDGVCVDIPYSGDGSIPRSTRVKVWPSCEVNECIFIFYHADDVEPWRLPEIEEIDNGELVFQGRNEFLVNCHCQEIPENGADAAHFNTVHGPSVFAGSDLRYLRAEWATFSSHSWDANWDAGEDKTKHIAIIELTHAIRLFNKFEMFSMDVDIQQVGPAYAQLFLNSMFGQFVVLQTVVPVEPLLQKIIHRFYLRPYTPIFSKFIIWGESVMFERDMMVWNSKRYLDNPRLLQEDHNIKAFRKWFQQFYSTNSKTYAEARKVLEW